MRVIIIGAGLLGTTTAWFLARQGHEVMVLERRDNVARETSFANGGIVHAGYAAPWNSPAVPAQLLRWAGRADAPMSMRLSAFPGLLRWGLAFLRNSSRSRFERSLRANARLAAYSLEQLRALRARQGLRYDASTRGALGIFPDPSSLDAAAREASLLRESGIRFEQLDRAQLLALEPALAHTDLPVAGALHYPDDESGDALRFTEEMAALARAEGVAFGFDTAVTALVSERGRITAVRTGRDTWHCDACVLAAGSHSAALARPLGLRLPIYPVKGYSITVPLSDTGNAPALPIIDSRHRMVMTRLGGSLRVAGFAEFSGFDTRLDQRRTRALLQAAQRLFPALKEQMDTGDLSPWAGLRPMTPDGRPLLGSTCVPGLFLATGTGHLGWTFAAGAGRLVADAVSGNRPAIDPAQVSTATG